MRTSQGSLWFGYDHKDEQSGLWSMTDGTELVVTFNKPCNVVEVYNTDPVALMWVNINGVASAAPPSIPLQANLFLALTVNVTSVHILCNKSWVGLTGGVGTQAIIVGWRCAT